MTKYKVELTRDQREELEQVIKAGQARARKIMHAHILLSSDRGPCGPGWSEAQIEHAFGVGESTIIRVRKRFLEQGLADALDRRPQPPRPEKRILNGREEAYLIAISCGEKPEGRERWSVRLLAHKLVEAGYVEQIGRETTRGGIKKNELKPWLKEQWCIPAKKNAEFVYHMEDVLEVYHRSYDVRFPQVCMDEGSKQLLSDKREGEPMQPGQPERYDSEYDRHGTISVFVATEPLAGKRVLHVSKRRTKKDWAFFMRDLIEVQYGDAEKIVLVMDNLNTHSPSSFYEAFEPEEARRLTEKLEIHYTPKHGSWLNMAEIELSVLARQCLAGRIPTLEQAQQRVQAWQQQRDQAQACIDWRFTAADARIKLKHLYPTVK
ncbi:MAG: IS630 family transposase [Ktedonobacteraceae bacterium]|nr:IS630 family transposase [Ktedonobacteraceae bacterium]